MTPDTARTVEQALATRDSTTIDRYRRFLEPILRRIEARNAGKVSNAETPCR